LFPQIAGSRSVGLSCGVFVNLGGGVKFSRASFFDARNVLLKQYGCQSVVRQLALQGVCPQPQCVQRYHVFTYWGGRLKLFFESFEVSATYAGLVFSDLVT
jgi:hypothetical protein